MDALITFAILMLLLLPLGAVFGILITSKKTTVRFSGSMSFLFLLLSTIISWILFFYQETAWNQTIYYWFESPVHNVPFAFYLDSFSRLFLVLITSFVTLFFLFALENMTPDKKSQLFLIYFNLAVFLLITVVISRNLLLVLMAVQLIAVLNYFLIKNADRANNSESPAGAVFFGHSFAGLALFVFSVLLLATTGSLDFIFPETMTDFVASSWSNFGGLLLLVFSCCYFFLIPLCYRFSGRKSNFITFSFIHLIIIPLPAVYLLTRLSFLFNKIWFLTPTFIFIGLLFAFLGSLIALMVVDIDEILFFNLLAQIGVVFVAFGIQSPQLAVYLTVTNLFLFALLFLGTAAVKSAMKGESNIFKMGRLSSSLPLVTFMFLIAALGLSGFPFLAGYWPRQQLLVELWNLFAFRGLGITMLLVLSLWFCALNLFRLLLVVFWSENEPGGGVHESGPASRFVMLIILAGIISGGLFTYYSFFTTIEFSKLLAIPGLIFWAVLVLSAFAIVKLVYADIFLSPQIILKKSGPLARIVGKKFYLSQLLSVPGKNSLFTTGAVFFDFYEKYILPLPGICFTAVLYLKASLTGSDSSRPGVCLRRLTLAIIFLFILSLLFKLLVV
ncbi:MAG: proton-conducting transporter membrane subunit [bacterium]